MSRNNHEFISRIAALQADFFLSLTEFCALQLRSRIQNKENFMQKQSSEAQGQQQHIYKHGQEQLDEQESLDKEQQKQQVQKKKEGKRKGRPPCKPLFKIHKPKAPTTSYLLYLHDNKAEISNKYKLTNISQITKAASQQWKKLPEEQKQQYCTKAEQLKAKYHSEMEVYRQKYAQELKQQKKKRQFLNKSKEKRLNKKNRQKQVEQAQRQRIAKGRSSNVKDNKVIEVESSLNSQQDSLMI